MKPELPAPRAIDAHVHVGPWRTPDFAGHRSDFGEALRVYDRPGFAGALLMGTDAGVDEDLLAAVRAHRPGLTGPEFRFVAWVDPGRADMMGFLDREADAVAALKIHPSFLRRPATDPAFDPYYRWAAERGRPLIVHCGRWQEMSSYRLALDVASRHPDLAVILAHMGGDSPDLIQATVDRVLELRLDNAFLGTESIRHPWLLQRAAGALGASRLVFGSDYNLNSPASFRVIVEELDLPTGGLEAILAGNINGLLAEPHRFF